VGSPLLIRDDAVTAGDTTGHWIEAFNTQAPAYGGFARSGNSGGPFDGSSGTLTSSLPAQSVIVFRKV